MKLLTIVLTGLGLALAPPGAQAHPMNCTRHAPPQMTTELPSFRCDNVAPNHNRYRDQRAQLICDVWFISHHPLRWTRCRPHSTVFAK